MDGTYSPGFFKHPSLGIIKVFQNSQKDIWVYQCYSDSGTRVLSKERPMDQWIWALSEPWD